MHTLLVLIDAFVDWSIADVGSSVLTRGTVARPVYHVEPLRAAFCDPLIVARVMSASAGCGSEDCLCAISFALIRPSWRCSVASVAAALVHTADQLSGRMANAVGSAAHMDRQRSTLSNGQRATVSRC